MKYFNRFFTLALLSSVSLCQAMEYEWSKEEKESEGFLRAANRYLDNQMSEEEKKAFGKFAGFIEEENNNNNVYPWLNGGKSGSVFEAALDMYLDGKMDEREKNAFGKFAGFIEEENNNDKFNIVNNYKFQPTINNNNENIIQFEKEQKENSFKVLVSLYGYGLDFEKLHERSILFLLNHHTLEFQDKPRFSGEEAIIKEQIEFINLALWVKRKEGKLNNIQDEIKRYKEKGIERFIRPLFDQKDPRFKSCKSIVEAIDLVQRWEYYSDYIKMSRKDKINYEEFSDFINNIKNQNSLFKNINLGKLWDEFKQYCSLEPVISVELRDKIANALSILEPLENQVITKELELVKKEKVNKKELVEHFLKVQDSRFNSCKTREEGLERFKELEELGAPLNSQQQPPMIPEITNVDYAGELSMFEQDEKNDDFALFQKKWRVMNPQAFVDVTNVDYKKEVTFEKAHPNLLSLREFRRKINNKDNKEEIIDVMKEYEKVFEGYAKEKKLKDNDYLVCYRMNGYKKNNEGDVEINFFVGNKREIEVNNILRPGILGVYCRDNILYCKFKDLKERIIEATGNLIDLKEKFENFKNKLQAQQEILDDRSPIRSFIKEHKYILNEEDALKFTSKELLFLIYKSSEEKIEDNNNIAIIKGDKEKEEIEKPKEQKIDLMEENRFKTIPLKFKKLYAQQYKEENGILTITTDNNKNATYQAETQREKVNPGDELKIPFDITVEVDGKMSFGVLNTLRNGWIGGEVILETGVHMGIKKVVIPENESEISLVLRNYHLGTPGQSKFTAKLGLEKK